MLICIEAFLLTVALSVDSLATAVSYGINKSKITVKTAAIISVVCTLLLALDEVLAKFPERCEYFPAYEIVLDELRDYRFYAADMIHPSDQAVDYLWSRFVRFAMPESELPALDARRRELLRAQHRPIHG